MCMNNVQALQRTYPIAYRFVSINRIKKIRILSCTELWDIKSCIKCKHSTWKIWKLWCINKNTVVHNLVLTIPSHGLTTSDDVGIRTGSLVFSCSKDDYKSISNKLRNNNYTLKCVFKAL